MPALAGEATISTVAEAGGAAYSRLEMPRRFIALCCVLLPGAVLAPAAQAVVVHLSGGSLALPPALGERIVSGVAGGSDGNVYVGARGSGGSSVVVFDREGQVVRSFDIGSISANSGRDGGCRCDELDLALGPDGLLYVGQPVPNLGAPQDRYISVYTTSGSLVREIGFKDEGTLWIADLEVDAAGSIYALVRHAGQGLVRGDARDEVLRIEPGGTISARFALSEEETAGFDSEMGGLALAPDGSIWVTTPADGSRLVRFAADGTRLSVPPLDTIIELKNRSVEDVDFADGLLYIAAGKPNGMVVITPEGRRVDSIGGEARQLAIAGKTVYATKLGAAATGGSAQAAQSEREDRLNKYFAAVANPPNKPSGVYESSGGCDGVRGNRADTLLHIQYPARATCAFGYINYSTPRCGDRPALRPINIFVGGRALGTGPLREERLPETAAFELNRDDVGDGGNVVVEWACPDRRWSVFEVKGAIDLIDPSGNVLDIKTGRPIEFATVRLEFTPVRGGSFGRPSLALMRPQVNPQTTGADGAFAWDVAAGFWRLRVKAFGYKPFTSATFEIPPEVTGLMLRLRRGRAFRKLIDPAGSVGTVRVGRKLQRRVAGLRVRVRRGRISEIAVRRPSFRTAAGIRLRSTELDVLRAYPTAKRSGRIRRGTTVLRFKRTFFSVRRGRVVAIRLAAG